MHTDNLSYTSLRQGTSKTTAGLLGAAGFSAHACSCKQVHPTLIPHHKQSLQQSQTAATSRSRYKAPICHNLRLNMMLSLPYQGTQQQGATAAVTQPQQLHFSSCTQRPCSSLLTALSPCHVTGTANCCAKARALLLLQRLPHRQGAVTFLVLQNHSVYIPGQWVL